MRRTLAIILTALTLLAGRPAQAAPAEDCVAGGASFQQVIREANQLLVPAAQQRGQVVVLDINGCSAVAADTAERTRDRVLNLVANALAAAPAKSRIAVRFDPQSYTVTVTVRDERTAVSTSRDLVDPMGNAFHVSTIAGQGSELNASLLDAPLTADFR